MGENIEEIKILPPVPGSCPLCAVQHDPGEPHERDSLYYQNKFYKKYKRFPTWEDAMSHCSPSIKKEFIKRLKRRGINIENPKKGRKQET